MSLRHMNQRLRPESDATLAMEGYQGGLSTQLAHEISSDVATMQRLHDIAISLEDLCKAADGVSQASPQHLLMIEAALNLAQAGTSYSAEALVPSLETYVGQQVSMEGLNQKIRAMIDAILRFLAQLGEKIMTFFEALITDVGQLKMRISSMEDKIGDYQGSMPSKPSFSLGNDVYGVATDHGYPQDGHLFVMSLATLEMQARMIFQQYTPAVLTAGRNLAGSMRKTHLLDANPEEWLAELNTAAAAYNVNGFKLHVGKTMNLLDVAYPMGSAVAGSPLPGLRSLVFVDGEKIRTSTASGNQTVERAAVIQNSKVEVSRVNGGKTFDPTMSTMSTMPYQMAMDALKHVDRLADEMNRYVNGGARRELKGVLKDLQVSAEAIRNSNGSSNEFLSRGLQYAVSYKSWVKTQVDFLALVYSVCNSSLNVLARNGAAYR